MAPVDANEIKICLINLNLTQWEIEEVPDLALTYTLHNTQRKDLRWKQQMYAANRCAAQLRSLGLDAQVYMLTAVTVERKRLFPPSY